MSSEKRAVKKDSFIPIFIVGAMHSGTSIVHNMLAKHPSVGWVSQFSFRDGRIRQRGWIPGARWIDTFLRKVTSFSWKKEGATLKRYFIPKPNEGVWELVFDQWQDMGLDRASVHLRSLIEDEAGWWNHPRFVIKHSEFYRYLDLVNYTYPGARLIHIVRDGRAVALSDRRKYMHEAEDAETALVMAARYWVDVVQSVRGRKAKIHVHELRYEDLCRDVEGTLRDVAEFLEISAQQFPFEDLPVCLECQNGKWLQNATVAELEVIERLQENLLAAYGYAIGGDEPQL